MPINLEKGQRIKHPEKSNGSKLQTICVGINWGAIVRKGLFGLTTTKEAVDLDASCAMYDDQKQLLDANLPTSVISAPKIYGCGTTQRG